MLRILSFYELRDELLGCVYLKDFFIGGSTKVCVFFFFFKSLLSTTTKTLYTVKLISGFPFQEDKLTYKDMKAKLQQCL